VPGPEEPSGPEQPGIPDYRPEVSLYTALPAMALRYGWATLDNLHERVGEEEQLRGRGDLREDNYLNALWVRVIGEDGNVRGASQGIYNGSPQYDYIIMAFQAGMDVFAEEHENQQRDHAGLYLGTGRIRSDVTNYDGSNAGDDIVKGQSLGLYWTHFWTEGQYLDVVWQGTWSKYSAKSDEGLDLHHSNFGWAASLEGGYPFHDDSQVWEPQAQVIYQRVNSGQTSDAAAIVRFSNITSLVGRAGLRWANTWTQEPAADGSPRLFTGWLRFNLWKEFKGRPTTSFSSEDGFVPFDGSIKGSWWQLNGGLTWELDKNTSFYANLGYQKGFSSRGFHAWDGKVGFRWNW
jgi:outer membrane autotransporter protein